MKVAKPRAAGVPPRARFAPEGRPKTGGGGELKEEDDVAEDGGGGLGGATGSTVEARRPGARGSGGGGRRAAVGSTDVARLSGPVAACCELPAAGGPMGTSLRVKFSSLTNLLTIDTVSGSPNCSGMVSRPIAMVLRRVLTTSLSSTRSSRRRRKVWLGVSRQRSAILSDDN